MKNTNVDFGRIVRAATVYRAGPRPQCECARRAIRTPLERCRRKCPLTHSLAHSLLVTSHRKGSMVRPVRAEAAAASASEPPKRELIICPQTRRRSRPKSALARTRAAATKTRQRRSLIRLSSRRSALDAPHRPTGRPTDLNTARKTDNSSAQQSYRPIGAYRRAGVFKLRAPSRAASGGHWLRVSRGPDQCGAPWGRVWGFARAPIVLGC